MDISGFNTLLTRIVTAFNPTQYDTLVALKKRQAILYFIQMTALIFVVTLLLMIPNLFSVPEMIHNEFSKFERLEIDVNYSQVEPINLPEYNPVITIDTTPAPEKTLSGFMLITDRSLYYRLTPFTKGSRIAIEQENTTGIGNVVVSLLVLSLPTLLVLTYLYILLKYGIIICFVALLSFILARVARFGLELPQTFKIALFASTPMITLALLTKPYVPSLGYLEYLVYLIFFILGCIKIGDFEEVAKPKERDRERRI